MTHGRSGIRAAAVLAACLAALSAAPADRPTARVAVDVSGPSTRLVVTLSRAVPAKVETSDGRVTVAFAEPVDFAPSDSRLDDAIVSGWQAKGDRTLVLTTGAAFARLESFELKNPPRLVVDLHGERPAKPAAAAGRGRAGSVPATVVVLDPGHGGVETGAVGPAGLQEKDVALDLARRLETVLEKEPGVSVVLTRDEDRLVPLDERAAIANHNRAELFVSIHLNASKRRGAHGAETYFLSPDATDDEARTLAALENRASGIEATPESGTPSKPSGLDLILWDLAQNQYLAESGRLAESVQREMNALAGTKDRGVRQAPLRVLQGATCPAILVEVGFISEPDEEARFKDPAHLERVTDAIARAVREYLAGRARLDAPGAAR